MKKFYGIKHLRRKRQLYENFTKMKYHLIMKNIFWQSLFHRSLNTKFLHAQLLADKSNFNHIKRSENKKIRIAHNTKYIPTHLIVYDLFPKMDSQNFLYGWKRLSSRCRSAGLGSNIGERSIIKYINKLHDESNINSMLNIGMFHSPISDVDYFRCYLYNFSPSLCLLKFDIHLSKAFEKKWSKALHNKCIGIIYKDKLYVEQKSRSLGEFIPASESKQVELHEDIEIAKWNFFNFISKILDVKLLFFNKGISSPTILMIDTNITPNEYLLNSNHKKETNFKSDTIKKLKNYNKYLDFDAITEIDNSHKIGVYERVCLSPTFTNDSHRYVKYFYNSDKIKTDSGFGNDVVLYLTISRYKFLDYTGYLLCLGLANSIVKKNINVYLNKIHNIRMSWRKYHKILKMQFNYRNNIFYFDLIRKEKDWEEIKFNYKNLFPKIDHKEFLFISSPEYLISNIYNSKDIDVSINTEKILINNKISLIHKLSEKKNSRNTLFLNVFSSIIALLALIISLGSFSWNNLMINIHHIFYVIRDLFYLK